MAESWAGAGGSGRLSEIERAIIRTMAESHAVPEPVDAVDRAYDDGWRDGAWRIAAAVIDPEAAWRCQRAAYRLHRLRARREGVRDA